MSYEYYGPGLGTNGDSNSTEEPATIFERGWEWFRGIQADKETQQSAQQPAPMPGTTSDGKPSAAGFADYAREAAVRQVAAIDEEIAPIQETPPGSEEAEEAEARSGIERYQTHITLISTLVGLGTFIVWLLLRKKKDRR